MCCLSKKNKSCQCDGETEDVNDGVKRVMMCEIEFNLDDDTVEKLKALALQEIANDQQGLIQYIVPKLLLKYIENQKALDTKSPKKAKKTKKSR